MPESLLLGLDIGTTRTKGLLVDRSLEKRALCVRPTPFRRVAEGAETTVEELLAGLEEVLRGLGSMDSVAAVGIAGIAESGAPLDGEGRALAPILAWHDPRGAEVVAMLGQLFGDELARRTGRRLSTVSSAAKLGWVLSSGVADVARWAGVPELVQLMLTGKHSTEGSLASRTGWFDVAARAYIPEVLHAIGVAPDALPPVGRGGEVMGLIGSKAAAWSGLPAGVPVTIAGHDHVAGMTGLGPLEREAFNSVGTAETLLASRNELPDVAAAVRSRVAVSLRPDGEGWVAFASGGRPGLVLAKVASSLRMSLPELDEASRGCGAVDGTELVEAFRAGRDVRLPDAPECEIYNGVLDALVDRTADAVARLAEIAGGGERVVVFGGGSRSRPWLARKAARLPLPVYRVRADEVVARGAAVFAGIAAGWWPSPEAAPRAALDPIEPGMRPGPRF